MGGRFDKFIPVIQLDEITSGEELALAELVALSDSPTGQFIRKVSGSFVNSTLAETIALAGLSDVTITTPAVGDLLVFNGTNYVNLPTTTSGYVFTAQGVGALPAWTATGAGTVTTVSVVSANGVSGSVADATTTPAITITLGAITPSDVQISGLTASEIVITDASKNLASAGVATYPSLTELSYVKGVTSAIQTQINTKAPSTAPTFATSITGSYLTASEILITDASKNIVSAAVATYPSLTELTYVKGVTSAIQTQFSGKQATITFGTGVLTALGINVGSAGAPVLFDGALGTPSSGTLTNASGLPISGLVASTSTAIGVGSVELGHASDTTISRSAAGVMAVEGVVIPSISSTNTLTNKRVQPRIVSASSYTTDTGTSLNIDNCDLFIVTAQAGALLFNSPGGTLAQGEKLIIRIKDDGTARALTWNAVFRAMGTALPSTTVLSKTLYLGFFYNSTDTKWDLVASAQEA